MSIQQLGRSSFGDPSNCGNLLSIQEFHQLLNDWVPNERLASTYEAGSRSNESLGH